MISNFDSALEKPKRLHSAVHSSWIVSKVRGFTLPIKNKVIDKCGPIVNPYLTNIKYLTVPYAIHVKDMTNNQVKKPFHHQSNLRKHCLLLLVWRCLPLSLLP